MAYIRWLVISLVFAALGLVAAGAPAGAQTLPVSCTYKVTATPDFFQEDPRGNFPNHGRCYCNPTAVADSFFYLASQGFHRLLPPNTEISDQTAGLALINTLASGSYMSTDSQKGTHTSSFLWGISRYVTERGYVCKRLEYVGPAAPGLAVSSAKIGSVPDIDWIKEAVARPNCCVWLKIGLYVRGSQPGQWMRVNGHMVAVVGYETGAPADAIPTILLVDNPGRQLSGAALTTDTMLQDDRVYLTPLTGGELHSQWEWNSASAAGCYILSGPGVPHSRRITYILDGAVVLEIAKPAGS